MNYNNEVSRNLYIKKHTMFKYKNIPELGNKSRPVVRAIALADWFLIWLGAIAISGSMYLFIIILKAVFPQ